MRYSREVVALFQSQKIFGSNAQHLAKHEKLVVGNKASADLYSADAVSFYVDAFGLQFGGKIFLRKVQPLRASFTLSPQIFLLPLKSYIFIFFSTRCVNVKNILDFNIFLIIIVLKIKILRIRSIF